VGMVLVGRVHWVSATGKHAQQKEAHASL